MKKVLVEIYLPSTNQEFDVILPKRIYVYQAVKVIADMMNKLTNGVFIQNDETVLCNKNTGEIFSMNKTIEELSLKNGAKLMLL